MKSTLTIREAADGLIVGVSSPPSTIRAAVVAVFLGSVLYFTTASYLGILALFLAVIGALVCFLFVRQPRTVRLYASNLDFSTKSSVSGDGQRPWVVSRADIRSMYFDRKRGGLEADPYYPPGLYADLGSREACLLPFVDEEQALEVMIAIYKRFPDMPIRDEKSLLDRLGFALRSNLIPPKAE